jgi:hypothetical protein
MVFSSLAASCSCCAENPLIPVVQICAATSVNGLFKPGIILTSKQSRLLVPGNFAALMRRSIIREQFHRTQPRLFGTLALELWQPQLFKMMPQKDLRGFGHAAVLPIRLM